MKDCQQKYLILEMRRLNKWLDRKLRRKAQQITVAQTRAKYQGGIILPFSPGDDKDPWVIAGMIPELARTFETKDRCPFKIVFEVVRLSELVKMSETSGQNYVLFPTEGDQKQE